MFTYALSTRKTAHDQYVIRCFKDHKRYPDGDYYTDDKDDAFGTMTLLEKAEEARVKVQMSKDRIFLASLDALDTVPECPLAEGEFDQLKKLPVTKWPPILMKGDEIYDGVARVRAARMVGSTHIPARRV